MDRRMVPAQDVPPLREFGHELIVPTLTGLGERQHLASKRVGLDTHVTGLLQVMHYDDLANVAPIGHSYEQAKISSKLTRRGKRCPLNGTERGKLDSHQPRLKSVRSARTSSRLFTTSGCS